VLRALIRSPYSNEISLGDKELDRLDSIRKNRRIPPQKFLDLIEITSFDARRCFAVADNIRRNEAVKHIRLAAVPCVEKTPDYRLVLLRRSVH